jgi:hypothetical protein
MLDSFSVNVKPGVISNYLSFGNSGKSGSLKVKNIPTASTLLTNGTSFTCVVVVQNFPTIYIDASDQTQGSVTSPQPYSITINLVNTSNPIVTTAADVKIVGDHTVDYPTGQFGKIANYSAIDKNDYLVPSQIDDTHYTV